MMRNSQGEKLNNRGFLNSWNNKNTQNDDNSNCLNNQYSSNFLVPEKNQFETGTSNAGQAMGSKGLDRIL